VSDAGHKKFLRVQLCGARGEKKKPKARPAVAERGDRQTKKKIKGEGRDCRKRGVGGGGKINTGRKYHTRGSEKNTTSRKWRKVFKKKVKKPRSDPKVAEVVKRTRQKKDQSQLGGAGQRGGHGVASE